jgi:electron transfer flavoprotein alpha subunit
MMLVYCEDLDVACELVTLARGLASTLGTKVTACVPEDVGAADAVFAHGADRVILLKSWSNIKGCDAVAMAIERVVKMVDPRHVLIGGTKPGKEVGAYLAAKMCSGCISEIKKATVKEGRVVATRAIYGGRFTSEISVSTAIGVLIVAPHAFEKVEAKKSGTPETIDVADIGSHVKLMSTTPEPKTDVNLAAAQVIVCVGRGLKKKEDLPMVQEIGRAHV